jgi:hypothetical protein
MTPFRSLSFLGIVAAATLFAVESSAADRDDAQPTASLPSVAATHKHRLTLGGGYETAIFNAGIDGHYNDSFDRPNANFGYAYRGLRGAEMGVGVSNHSGSVWLLAPSIRGYIPIGSGDPVELGLSLRPSFMVASHFDHTWTGFALSAGPDVRVWVSDEIGLQLSGEGAVGGADTKRSRDNPNETYLSGSMFAMLGGSLSLVWRP